MGAPPSTLGPYPGLKSADIAYASASVPLLSTLHQRLSEYEDAVDHVFQVRQKYGLSAGFHIDPPSGEIERRMKRTQTAFDAVLSHVDAVDAKVSRDYVVLRREACGAANVLFHARPSTEEFEDRQRTVYTRSPILQNSSQLALSFRPFPSRELLIHSPILSHSNDLKYLAASPEYS